MANKIKVHYYSISKNNSKDLNSTLKELEKLTPEQRIKSIHCKDIHLELVTYDSKEKYWFMHFTNARKANWPGQAPKGQTSTDLNVPIGTNLTENTFAAYDPIKGILTIQYTLQSIRITKLFLYIDTFLKSANNFSYFVVLNSNALMRYNKKTLFTSIEAVIENVSDADLKLFQGSPYVDVIRESVDAGVKRINLAFKVDGTIPTNRIKNKTIKNLVDKVLKRQGTTNGGNDKLTIKGRDNVNSNIEAVDLLEDVKFAEYPEKRVKLTIGRRYHPDDMKIILFDALGK